MYNCSSFVSLKMSHINDDGIWVFPLNSICHVCEGRRRGERRQRRQGDKNEKILWGKNVKQILLL